MSKPGFTDVTIVLDRSGSMGSCVEDTKGGFDRFVADQKALPGECRLTLVQFDNVYEFVHQGVPIAEVPPLVFVPRGGTALLDAMGRAINETGARIGAMAEVDRPEHVVFVVLTDGGENSSKEFSRDKVFEMVKHQTETYKWHFVFLGANQDAISAGAGLGVTSGNAMNYAANAVGTRRVYAAASSNLANLRGGAAGTMGFTAEQREEQVKAGAPA